MHIEDLVKIIFEFVYKDIKGKIFNICYQKNYTIPQVINFIYKMHGKKLSLKRGSFYKVIKRYKFSPNLSLIESLKKEYKKL